MGVIFSKIAKKIFFLKKTGLTLRQKTIKGIL